MRFGLHPARVIGDFDSLSGAELLALEQDGAHLERHPAHKDETDLELALLYAARTDPTGEITILGGLGGRLDQTIANVMLLAMPALRDCRVMIAAGDEQALLDYRRLAPHGAKAHPSEDHLVSLYFALGAAHCRGRRLSGGVTLGSLSMDSFVFDGSLV